MVHGPNSLISGRDMAVNRPPPTTGSNISCLYPRRSRPPERFFESAIERNNILTGVGILAVYLFFMPKIGFLPASYLFYLVLSLYLSEDRLSKRNILVSVLLSGGVVALFYFLFHQVLEVPLPRGAWFA